MPLRTFFPSSFAHNHSTPLRALSSKRHIRILFSLSDALDADNHGGVSTSEAIAGLAHYCSGHDYLDVPGLDVSPRAFPRLTIGAWVKVNV